MEPEVGARIRRLREAAGLLSQELASRVGLDATVLSKIENGKRGVKSTELARLADALKVSPLALLEDDALLASLPVVAREAGASIVDGAAYAKLLSLTELHVVLADAGIPTSPDFAPVPSVVGLDWYDSAQTLSDWATQAMPLSFPNDRRLEALAELIENVLKVDVLIEAFPGDPLSGAAIADRSFPLLFVNADHSTPRCLFTLAHELGHMLAGGMSSEIILDRELAGSTDSEKLANAFAAEYLLPEVSIRDEVDRHGITASTLVGLTDRFGVGYESLIYRLHSLRLIDAEDRSRLIDINWEQLVVTSLHSRQRAHKLIARSQDKPKSRWPELLSGRAIAGYRKGILGIRPVASLLQQDPLDLQRRLGADGSGFPEFDRLGSTATAAHAENETTEELFSGIPV